MRALIEALVDDQGGLYRLNEDERSAIEVSKTQARRGEFVSDAETEAF